MALPKNTLPALKAAFMILGGVAMITVGAWFGVANMRFAAHADHAPGIVIDIAKQRGSRGLMLHFPVVRFRPAERGSDTVFKARPGLWPSPYGIGDRVVVGYDAENPEDAKILSFWMLWFLPGITTLFGIACLFAGRHIVKKIV